MAVECAKCKSLVCHAGRPELAPPDCPMWSGLPSVEELYGDSDRRKLAYQSALVEASGYCRWTRLREIAEFAQRMSYTRIGIAHCPDMAREAILAALYLRDAMFEVRLPPAKYVCDPHGQARAFARERTKLNVIAGMCVGHEAVFTLTSRAPVTSLLARDERFFHNPVVALYTSESYSHAALYGHSRSFPVARSPSRDVSTLMEVAHDLQPDKHERWCRIREAMEFARQLGAKHIGLSFCVGLRSEAAVLTRILEANGFEVTSVCCKTGAVPKSELGIQDHEQIRPNQPEMMCNPLAQAELLNRERVELAFIVGQCVGHDSATIGQLEAPAVCVVTKDRVLGHNTAAALYQLESLPASSAGQTARQ
jgi:uncharacterized metal-binding protein